MADMDKNDAPKVELKKPTLEGDDKTAKIAKPPKAGDDQKVVLNAGTDSAIRPSDATKISPSPVQSLDPEETLTMDRSEVKDVPQLAGTADAAPISKKEKSKTIKLKPLKPVTSDDDANQEETLSMDRGALLENEMPTLGGGKPGVEDEATIKIQKPTTSNKPAHPTPNIPGSKETIKLRPSSATPPPADAQSTETDQETISMSKKTIRLVPKQPGNTSEAPTQKTAKPSAPTVKMNEAAPAPSAPTVKMPDNQAPQTAAPAAAKRTLKLKSNKPAAPQAPQPAAPPASGGAKPPATPQKAPSEKQETTEAPVADDKSAEPKIVLTLVAIFTFILIAYYAFMVFGQWQNVYQDGKINVPFASGRVK